jgi:long-chain fatty acid transport protein
LATVLVILSGENDMARCTTTARASRRTLLRRLSLFSLAVALVCPGPAFADGWKIQLQGVKALGLGYAGRALAEDATTVWFNPAGMTRLEQRWTITTGLSVISFDLAYTDRGSRNVLGLPLLGLSSINGGQTPVPPPFHFYAVRRLGTGNDGKWWVGLGVNAPHGLIDDYGRQWTGRYHATNSELRVLNVNPNVAYKLNDRVSIGVGFDVQRSTATLANRLDFGSFAAALGLPLAPQTHDGGIELTSSDLAFGYDLSLAWQVTSQTRVASTYRSQIEHTLEGTADFEVPATASLLKAAGGFVSTSARAVLPMPRELSGSVSHELNDRWTVVGDVTWTDWSQFERLDVTFGNPAQPPLAQDASYDDSVRGAGGVVFRATDTWTFRGGGLYEVSPVPDGTRTPRLPEVNNAGFTLGGSYRLGPSWDLDFAWSHLIPHDAPIALTDPSAGRLTGDVRWHADAFAVGANLKF